MKKTYTYIGKENLIFSSKGEDFNCVNGKDYEFDSEDGYIKTLVAAKILKEKVKATVSSTKTVNTKPVTPVVADDKDKQSTTLEK